MIIMGFYETSMMGGFVLGYYLLLSIAMIVFFDISDVIMVS